MGIPDMQESLLEFEPEEDELEPAAFLVDDDELEPLALGERLSLGSSLAWALLGSILLTRPNSCWNPLQPDSSKLALSHAILAI
uniref:Uncharacterized protein n=1 Tax=Romanomermis culicivorax TaxID=13658 RepID=A0A915J0Z1_ROMCU